MRKFQHITQDQMDVLAAYELGLDDGFFVGVAEIPENFSDVERHAYRRGYDHGVALYSCDPEDLEAREDEPVGPCLCGRGECPECGGK